MGKHPVQAESTREEEIVFARPKADDEEVQALREKTIHRLVLLWANRRFLARTTGIGLLTATLIAFVVPKQFISTARLMPPDQGPGTGMAMMAALTSKAGSLGTFGSELLGLKTTGDLFIGILQSRTVEDDVIRKFNLRRAYGTQQWEDARRTLVKNTNVSQDRKSEIITISVTDRSPQRAQLMVREYITALDNVVVNLNTSSAHRERVFLQERLDQVQKDLESAERNFSQFASKNSAIDIQEQGKAMISASATLEGQLIAAQTELEGLKQIYTDNNVRVRETQARVDELNRQLRKLGGKAVAGSTGGQEIEGTEYPTIRDLPLLGVTYADLYRRMKVQDAVFGTLTQQYEAAKVEEAKETPSVKVLDPPDLPERKSFPPRLLIIFVGTLMAFAAGTVWLFAHEAWDQMDANDVRKAFAMQIWGDIRISVSGRSLKNRNPVGSQSGNWLQKAVAWRTHSEGTNIKSAGTLDEKVSK